LSVISGIDHVVIGVRDLAAAGAAYETLLGRSISGRSEHGGAITALIALDNIAVELMAPAGDGETAQRLRTALEDGEGLKSVVFAAPDIEAMHRLCTDAGLAPSAMNVRAALRSFRADPERTHGVRLFFIARDGALPRKPAWEHGASGLDHIVIRSGDMERAAALYGAGLGLDLRLDRELAGRRLMFFRGGDAIVEIAEDAALADGPDRLWGLSWRIANADAGRARLAAAGLDVSEVRAGMKPGTRVFTVRDGTCGVPTLMIEAAPKRD
jgi:catechol 2,3-dioxygenase-like lactoylglutathione lyase family enzyme